MKPALCRPSAGVAPARHGSVAARGFTLVELLISVAILALLAGGAIGTAELVHRRSQEQELRAALRDLRTAIDAYKRAVDAGEIARTAGETGYPRQLRELVDGVPRIADAGGRRIYFLRRLPRDPMAPADLPAELTWALRSHDSDPANPQPGRDVFDVMSRSERTGLDGRPYATW